MSDSPSEDLVSPAFAQGLVLDELFDLTLYKTLRSAASPELRLVLEQLIPIETRHMEFWRSFFNRPKEGLDWGRRLKLAVLFSICRVFGDGVIQLVLEGIEVHGIRKYLTVWEAAKGTPLGDAVHGILEDEMSHEDTIVLAGESRRMDPEKVSSIFLGFNDGCVEILGSVSGFMAAFHDTAHVLLASVLVGVAGALSMGAGAFVAMESEGEVAASEGAKRRFLEPKSPPDPPPGHPLKAALLVGVSYFVGAAVPITPLFLGARGLLWIVLAAGAAIVAVSFVVAFLTGMKVWRRVAL
jgi:VIT1/CCC1 family predicted Fe2+/Mn2+ transporter